MSAAMLSDSDDCRVYWGSHGCMLFRGHEGTCVCVCALDAVLDASEDPDVLNVGSWPYYGPQTRFYGEDVEARGLPKFETW